MKKFLIAFAALTFVVTGALAAPTPAQKATPAKTSAKKTPARKAPAKKAPVKKKAKANKKPSPLKVNPLTGANAPVEPLSPTPGVEFPAEAPTPYTGLIQCDSGVSVTVTQDPVDQFSYRVKTSNGNTYQMRQLPTRTGAIRLEDRDAGITWIQIGTKSMLMDQKRGVRMTDNCRNAQQDQREKELKAAPVYNPLL